MNRCLFSSMRGDNTWHGGGLDNTVTQINCGVNVAVVSRFLANFPVGEDISSLAGDIKADFLIIGDI